MQQQPAVSHHVERPASEFNHLNKSMGKYIAEAGERKLGRGGGGSIGRRLRSHCKSLFSILGCKRYRVRRLRRRRRQRDQGGRVGGWAADSRARTPKLGLDILYASPFITLSRTLTMQ
jgi:hypothetical protein